MKHLVIMQTHCTHCLSTPIKYQELRKQGKSPVEITEPLKYRQWY